MGSKRALDEQADRRRGVPILAQPDPFAGELVREGTFRPLGHGAAIPERRRACLG
jgi:hypothetical protein